MGELVAAVSLRYRAGDDLLLELTVTRDDAVVDITGMTPRFVVKRDADSSAVITTEGGSPTATATLTTPASGIFRIAIPASSTANLFDSYRFECELEDGSGDVQTIARGRITFEPSLI